jgi:hypothetical protein
LPAPHCRRGCGPSSSLSHPAAGPRVSWARRLKKITTGGTFRFQHKLLYLANSLVDHRIGLEETDDGLWFIHFNTVLLATLDERDS